MRDYLLLMIRRCWVEVEVEVSSWLPVLPQVCRLRRQSPEEVRRARVILERRAAIQLCRTGQGG